MSDPQQPAPDAGNTEDNERLGAPLDPDDDIEERIALVNREQPDRLEEAPDAT